MSDYIMDLRRIVGKRPLLQCAASVIIINEHGELLLGKRTDNQKWGYSGGSMNLGESVEDCARRELLEEMNLIADELEFFMINSGEETHYIYPNGDEVYNVEIVYLCRKYHGDMRPQESELSELRFFSPEQLPEVSEPIIPVFREYQKRIPH
ncbi:MAG: NUDIX domain-containing protein [Solobacterium sp.]|nr:NUDIX domain-containing protein [Solobacterium sp.]